MLISIAAVSRIW